MNVNWDDDIPNNHGKIIQSCSRKTTNQLTTTDQVRPEFPGLAVRPQDAHVVRQHPQRGAEDLLRGGLQHATERLDGDGEGLVQQLLTSDLQGIAIWC